MQNKYKKYIPSKAFVKITSIILLVLVIVFVASFLTSNKSSFLSAKKTNVNFTSRTIEELIQSDLDGDGIADWEEALWGTDKHNKETFGMLDSIYIENKKKELNINEEIYSDTELTETEKFAREFFTSFVALKASEATDMESIKNFSKNLGEKIALSTLPDIYSEKDLKIISNENTEIKLQYYNKLKKIFDERKKSDGLGKELSIISKNAISIENGNVNNENIPYEELLVIGEGYQQFAKEILEIETPKSLINFQIQMANSANNTGLAVINMQKMISDPVIGISGLSQYQRYIRVLVSTVNELENTLLKNL